MSLLAQQHQIIKNIKFVQETFGSGEGIIGYICKIFKGVS